MRSNKIINTIQLFPDNINFSSKIELKYLSQFLVSQTEEENTMMQK